MQVLKNLKKIAALGTGAVMLGATLTGALAADLGDYPAPFVVNGVYDDSNVFVYGNQALADDTAAMMDISSSFQFLAKTPVVSAGTTVSVTGGKTEQVPLGQGFSNSTYFDTTLQDDDISTLFDGAVNFQGTEYDTSEELQMCDRTEPFVATSLMTDDDYKRDVFLEMGKDKVRYAYRFDETILLNATTAANPLEIDFLGKTLKITSISADTSFTARVGDEFTLNAGDSVTVVGKTVTLENVGSSNAQISVDGVSKSISEGSTSTVNGVEITVDSVISRNELAESSAIIIAGLQATETYTDGDAYVGEDTDDPDWVWDVRALNGAAGISGYEDCGGTEKFVLRVENDFDMNDDSDNPTAVGGCIDLPNGFLSICIDSLTAVDADAKEVTMEFKSDADLSDANCPNTAADTSAPALYLYNAGSEGFDLRAFTNSSAVFANVSSNVKAQEVWLFSDDIDCGNALVNGTGASVNEPVISVFYKALDSPRKVKYFGALVTNATNIDTAILRLNIGNTKDSNAILGLPLASPSAANHTLEWKFVADTLTDLIGSEESIWSHWDFNSNGQFAALGDTLTTEEGEELQWVPGAGRSWTLTNIGTKDEDHRTAYGVVIVDPKGSSSSDKVKMLVPTDQVMANVVIKGSSATVTSGSTSYVPTKISPVYMKASEVSDPTMFNLIVVGGPCANSLAASVFDMSCDGWSLAEGEAVVKLVDNGNKVAMLVAGTTALDTQRAGKAVASSENYAFSGSEKMVKGATLQDITVE
ncbi:MAG: hypothetical protein KKB39_00950 [Nanoarchaeota archaeon]|nr:hypothetical protein [Nanoarchaeota archaeon]